MKRQIGDTYEVDGTNLRRVPLAKDEGARGIKVARQRAADLAREHSSILDATDGREISADERRLLDAIEAEVARVRGEILDRAEDIERATRGHSSEREGFGASESEPAAVNMLPALPARARAVIDRLYPEASDRRQAHQHFRDVIAAALGGSPLHPVISAASQTEGIPTDGGFAVMPDVARGLFVRAVEDSVWLRIGAHLEPMLSETRTVIALDDDDETGDAEGNLTADWIPEAFEGSTQVMKIRQVKLRAHKLMVVAATSHELAEDAPDFVSGLEDALGRAIGKKFDRAVLSGSGAGQPLGLLNAPATITVAKTVNGDTGAAGTFTWNHAIGMWARLSPGSHERAWWLAHPSVLPQFLTMTLPIKNVAGTENVGGSQPLGVFQAGGPTGYMMLGRPVLITSRVKPLSTAGDVILVDPTQVMVGIRRGITVERSMDAYFSSDRIGVRAKFRGDAQPAWEKPRTLVEGSDTVSPYVVLQVR